MLSRHGAKHDWYTNPITGTSQAVPRHREIGEGLRFVLGNRLLVVLALVVGGWQLSYNAALVVQIVSTPRDRQSRSSVIACDITSCIIRTGLSGGRDGPCCMSAWVACWWLRTG